MKTTMQCSHWKEKSDSSGIKTCIMVSNEIPNDVIYFLMHFTLIYLHFSFQVSVLNVNTIHIALRMHFVAINFSVFAKRNLGSYRKIIGAVMVWKILSFYFIIIKTMITNVVQNNKSICLISTLKTTKISLKFYFIDYRLSVRPISRHIKMFTTAINLKFEA
jgi:hypothetical protein